MRDLVLILLRATAAVHPYEGAYDTAKAADTNDSASGGSRSSFRVDGGRDELHLAELSVLTDVCRCDLEANETLGHAKLVFDNTDAENRVLADCLILLIISFQPQV